MKPPTGLVTFLFTDIEGSTRLSQEFQETLPLALEKHHSIMQDAIESNEGYVFEIVGDAFCCAFQNAEDAVKAAAVAQMNLSIEKWEDAVIKVRMGIHSDNSEWINDSYVGYISLARTARVMSAAYGEQILISNSTYELCRDKFDAVSEMNITFRDLGEKRLKDIIQPVRLFQIICPGLSDDFPPLKTLDARPNNLPVQLTSFIGRVNELKHLKELIKETRLLTLTGSGGLGKTRLAMQVAADEIDDFANGVWLIELASLTSPSLLPQSIAKVFGLKEEPKKNPEDTLCNYLKDKDMLIILDNCEHLIESCAILAERLLSHTAKLKILATSREALRCEGEILHRVSKLEVPDPDKDISPEEIIRYEAVRLFIERALLVSSKFRISDNDAGVIARICHRLDGIPLAIELAAARVKILSVEQINQRLSDRFKLLIGGNRTSLPRQQTLRHLIDWSYELLSEKEKILWRRLSVFSDGWTLEAAEEVCSDDKISSEEVLDLLHQLSEKSIIIFELKKLRYRMSETLKQYGVEKFNSSGEREDILNSHLQYFMNLAKKSHSKRRDIDAQFWMDKLESDHGNLKSAIEWSLNGGDKEKGALLTGALENFWDIRGYYSTGVQLSGYFLDSPDGLSKKALADVIYCSASLRLFLSDFEEAGKLFEDCLELNRNSGDTGGTVRSLMGLGNISMYIGNYQEAKKYYSESLTVSRNADVKSSIANTLNNLGNAEYIQGNLIEAQKLYEESLSVKREAGIKQGIDIALFNLGNIATDRGNLVQAQKFFEESLEKSRELGNRRLIAASLNAIGGIASEKGDFQIASKLIEDSVVINREIGEKRSIARSLISLGRLEMNRDNFEQAKNVFQECFKLTNEIGEKSGIANALNYLGNAFYLLDNCEAAQEHYEKSLEIRKELGEKMDYALTLIDMGIVLYSQGKTEEAQKYYKESLELQIESNEKHNIPDTLIGLAGTILESHSSEAIMLLGAADAILKTNNTDLNKVEKKLHRQILEILRERSNEDEFSKYFEEGKRLSPEKAVSLSREFL
jgi:predicted ATPase/class 3 adenylate cyclase/uncharacterized protein HemY